MLSKEKFVERVIKGLEETYGKGNVFKKTKREINEIEREGLCIIGKDKKSSPIIPVAEYYEAYECGTPVEEVIRDIKETYDFFEKRFGVKDKPDFLFKNIEDRIIFQVVGVKMNENRLNHLVNMRLPGDLAMVYGIDINASHVMMISKKMASEYGYNLEAVHEAAEKNTPVLYPATLLSLEDSVGVFPENRPALNDYDVNTPLTESAYVLSNNKNIRGATVMFYPEVREKLAKMLGGDFYAIPSSVHEFMIMSCDAGHSAEYLEGILRTANETVVRPKDKLSDKLLRYDAEEKHIDFAIPESVKEKNKEKERER